MCRMTVHEASPHEIPDNATGSAAEDATRSQEAPSLKGLSSLLGLQAGAVTGAALAATLAAALALVPFFVVARMATAIYASPPDLARVESLALVAAGSLLVRYVLLAAANMLAHVAAYRILHDLRIELAAKLGGKVHVRGGHDRADVLARAEVGENGIDAVEAGAGHHAGEQIAAHGRRPVTRRAAAAPTLTSGRISRRS